MSLEYYNSVKDLEHIFIYSVCGRTSSTALQRFINSSNEVCIWGEPWGTMNHMLDNIKYLRDQHSRGDWQQLRSGQTQQFKLAYLQNKHDNFYPNAFPELCAMIDAIHAGIAQTLKPANDAKRFGFKEIVCNSRHTIAELLQTFPNCKIVFMFRNPCKQWPSVNQMNCWDHSTNLLQFIQDYAKLANIYLDAFEHANNKNRFRFVENTDLYDLEKTKELMQFLNISQFDETLMGKIVSTRPADINPEDKNKILFSDAQSSFEKLKLISFSQRKKSNTP